MKIYRITRKEYDAIMVKYGERNSPVYLVAYHLSPYPSPQYDVAALTAAAETELAKYQKSPVEVGRYTPMEQMYVGGYGQRQEKTKLGNYWYGGFYRILAATAKDLVDVGFSHKTLAEDIGFLSTEQVTDFKAKLPAYLVGLQKGLVV